VKPILTRRWLFIVMTALLLVMTVSVSARTQSDSAPAGPVRWLTYVDPRFDFTIKYPANWQVIPRDDSDPTAVSGFVVFMPVVPPNNAGDYSHGSGPYVTVGPYLAELKNGQSLSEWTDLYESLGHESDRAAIQRQTRKVFRVNGARALHEEGISPLTTYQFTNAAHRSVVWDIWTNIPSSDPLATVYNALYQRLTP